MIHASPSDRAGRAAGWATIHVNDVHARLNPTDMAEVWRPRNTEEAGAVLNWAARSGRRASVCGGRHAMGGQQFLASGVLIDTRAMSEIVHLDEERGVVRAQAGITWPELVRGLLTMQREPRWGIIQKQTGADRLTLGGALSANVHGRSLDRPPLVADVESFVVVSARGESIRCSRGENAGLFARVIGGYGLFGVITEVDLRLRERTKVRRRVEMTDAEAVAVRFDERIGEGFEYGDFQFEIDPCSAGFLRRGVFSCYEPVDDGTPLPASQRALGREDWLRLISLAHTDKSRAFEDYRRHYLATDGQIYWSDLHQVAEYVEGYHPAIDERLGTTGGEMITELFVAPEMLGAFLGEAARALRDRRADVIYGTVRRVQADLETALPWARRRCVGIVLNLHTEHAPAAIKASAAAFRELIDIAIALGGSFYLTYHRFARRDQLAACYPELPDMLATADRHDPEHTLDSDWRRHMTEVLSTGGGSIA